MNFWEEIYKKYIGYGEYQKNDNMDRFGGVFSPYHIVISLLFVSFIIIFTYKTRKYTQSELFKKQRVISWVMLAFEAFRFIWYRIFQGFWYFKYDLCNLICLFMPIFVLNKSRKSLLMWASVAFYGGTAVLLYPYGIFAAFNGVHIITIQSMISHGLMVLTSINLVRMYKIEFKKDLIASFIGYGILATISFVMCFVNDANYMALRDPQGIPVVNHLPFPISSFAIIGFIYLGIYLFLLVIKTYQEKFLCVDLKVEDNNHELQESNITI